MLTLPTVFIGLLAPFMPLFRPQTWSKAQLLLAGAVLSPGKRTITAALRVLGLSQEAGFAKYHHVLNRARWSPRELSKLLLFLLLHHLDTGQGPLVFGIDETLERRWGRKISARGIYRDAVRSSASHLVKASGLRWVSLMWLSFIPWSQRVWAFAGAHRPGTLGALLPTPGTTAQETHRLGQADYPPAASLAARPAPGAGGRQRLRRA